MMKIAPLLIQGVRIPHNVVLNRLNWQTKTFPYGCNERIGVFKTALTFVDSVSEIWGPLVNGLSLLVVPKSFTKDPEKFIDILDRYEVKCSNLWVFGTFRR